MKRVVAILETMWDWRSMTSNAGYEQAPKFFRINPSNHSGRRLYKLIGSDAKLLVTNACKDLVSGPEHHGMPDSEWLRTNLSELEKHGFDLLLICGKVAQRTFKECKHITKAKVLEIPHPAARGWSRKVIDDTAKQIRRILNG